MWASIQHDPHLKEHYVNHTKTARVDFEKAWPFSHQRTMLATALRSAGMSKKDIAAWLGAKPSMPLFEHIGYVLKWANAFPNAVEGRTWYDALLDWEDAKEWSAAGFTPRQAEQLTMALLCRAAAGRDVEALLRTEREWRESGLPPRWVLMCVRQGIDDMGTARLMFDALGNSRDA